MKTKILLLVIISTVIMILLFFIYNDTFQSGNVLSEEESLELLISQKIKPTEICKQSALTFYKKIKTSEDNNVCSTYKDCDMISLECFLASIAINKSRKAELSEVLKTVEDCLKCENVNYTPFYRHPIAICKNKKCALKSCNRGNCSECKNEGNCPKY